MARARNIKPSFFTNDELAEEPPVTRLLFIALWCLADREGRLLDRPRKIKGEAFPWDDFDCEKALAALAKRGFIERYASADGTRLIQVVAFAKHQRPHYKEPPSSLPPPGNHGPTKPQRSANHRPTVETHDDPTIDQSSADDQPMNRQADRPASTVGSRIPDTGYRIADRGSSDSGASSDAPTDDDDRPQPVDNSRPPIQQRAVDIVVLLRKQGARMTASDPRVLGWAERGITDGRLLIAMERALEARRKSGDPSPVNAGYLDQIVTTLEREGLNGGRSNGRFSPHQYLAARRAAEEGSGDAEGSHGGDVWDAVPEPLRLPGGD